MKNKIMFIIFFISIVISVSACSKNNSSKSADKKLSKMPIIGQWVTESGTLFEFTPDGRYGYYKNKSNTSDNYYKGPVRILNGQKALDDLKISDEEYNRKFKEMFGGKDNIYSIKMDMEILHSEGKDKSDTLDKSKFYYFAFYMSPDKTKAWMINKENISNMMVTKVK